MRTPPRYQLYDLENDPYEFRNLADEPEYSEIFDDLKQRLNTWRVSSDDPLLSKAKLSLLTSEVLGVKKKTDARKKTWRYPEYFSETEN